MKKYLHLLKFAFKEQLEYKWNFLVSIFVMLINDTFTILLFWIFFTYFTDIWLNIFDFVLVFSFATFYYGLINWLLGNLGQLWYIIETGRLDYYLSFPVSVIKLIAFTKIKIQDFWDLFFSLITILVYIFFYSHNYLDFLSWILIIIVWFFGIIGFTLILSCFSFIMDRGSEVTNLFFQLLFWVWDKPATIFEGNKAVFLLLSFLWLFPLSFLPYYIISQWWSIINRILLIVLNIWMFVAGVFLFKKGLKKYTSWNLIVQM